MGQKKRKSVNLQFKLKTHRVRVKIKKHSFNQKKNLLRQHPIPLAKKNMSWLINYIASPTVFGILKGALDNFIDGIDQDKFELDFRSGTVDLKDLKVKPKVITDLGILPKGCKLAWSHVGKLRAEVQSYTSKKPVVVQIDDVELVFVYDETFDRNLLNQEGRTSDSNNPFAAFAAATESAWDLKKRGVDVAWSTFEYGSGAAGGAGGAGGGADGTSGGGAVNEGGERGAWKNLDNLQIEITNVHVRFEDVVTMQETISIDRPFAGGVYFKKVALFSTNAQGEPIYVKDSDSKGKEKKKFLILILYDIMLSFLSILLTY